MKGKKTMDITNSNIMDKLYTLSDQDEEVIRDMKKSVKEKADYNLRQIISVTKRISDKVSTDQTDEFGCVVEDWNKITTKELINFFAEAAAWNYYSTPIRMQGFIESSLANIAYKFSYNTAITDPNATGTVAVKQANAEISTQYENYAANYRNLYTNYVTEVLKSFNDYLKRLEKIIEWRLLEERNNPKSPF